MQKIFNFFNSKKNLFLEVGNKVKEFVEKTLDRKSVPTYIYDFNTTYHIKSNYYLITNLK